jgi:cytochrome P450
LTPLIERGTFDLAAEFAVPLPMQVIAHMIGIPPGDWQTFRRWSDSILALSYDLTGGADATAGLDEYRAVTAEMAAYLPELIAQRQRRPQDDLLTRLVAAEVDGERLTPEELLGFFQLLVVGGQETTANLITTAVLSLLENPAQLALLRMQMDLLPGAIEETLRLRTPVQFVFRSTRRTVELGSQTIPAGKLALVMLGSANRDPQAFDRPNEFDIRRDPNPHLAFGRGIHFCLGAPLARLEARIALTDVLQRLPKLRLASDQPWPPRRALHVHGPTSLPVCT